MPTIEDIKIYLGIDWTDGATERRLSMLVNAAEKYLQGSLGVSFPRDDARVTELALIVIQDLYDNKGLNEKVSGNIRRLVDDFSTQLRMELRREAESAV